MIRRRDRPVTDGLVADGWFSPDTYDAWYEPIRRIPAVYLFMVQDLETFTLERIAYVGMTTDLKRRWSAHEVIAQIEPPGYRAMRWFKPVPIPDLRSVERAYIQKFDPPMNLAGRKKRLVLDHG